MEMTKINVTLKLTSPQLGTIPHDKEIYRKWIASKAPEGKLTDDDAALIEEFADKGYTGFLKDELGLCIPDYMVRGFMKSAGNILKEQMKLKQVKSKVDQFVFVFPSKLHFTRKGKFIKETEGSYERPIRVEGPKGIRTALVKSDYVDAGAEISFQLRVLKGPILESHLKFLFEYGTLCGLGQFRNGSWGRFEVLKWEIEA